MIIMFDLAITPDGDILFNTDTKEVNIVEDDMYRTQMAMCRIKSIKKDWFVDAIGADLEAVLGMPNTSDTLKLCISKITNAITFDSLYIIDEVYVDCVIVNPVSYILNVYLRTIDGTASTLIATSIDLVKGINIKLGG